MSKREVVKKRKYSLRMENKYNELLQSCKTKKRIKDLCVIFNKTSTQILSYVNVLFDNGHLQMVSVSEKIGLIEVLSLSDCVPENEFADYKPRYRRPIEDLQKYTWAGNPFRETI